MVISGVELLMSRRQIREMIAADPVNVVFRRTPKVDDGAGGWSYGTETSLASQTIRLIPFKRRITEFLKNTELGDVPDLPYIFLGLHTLDVLPGDRFTYNGDEYEVKTIDMGEPEVKTAGQVDYYGGGTNGLAP